MPLHAMWMHGGAVQVENWTAGNVGNHFIRSRDGITFHASDYGIDAFCYVHIPTPVITSDKRVRLEKVFVLYRDFGNARLKEVIVTDTSFEKKVFEDTTNARDWVGGDYRRQIVMGRSGWSVEGRPEVLWGVGVWFSFQFGASGWHPGPSEISVTAVGADFSTT